MSKQKMIPTIINDKSNFIICTWWWGRFNNNGNTQRPCPYEVVDDPTLKIKKNPITFGKMIENWEQKCVKHNCNYMAIEYPEFSKPGMYQTAINYKPTFIKEALKACYPRNVLYIDGDMTINRYPKIFDTQNVDLMVRNWNIDDRENLPRNICFNPYTIELSGGTMFFSQTETSKKILDSWIDITDLPENEKKADDTILSVTLSKSKYLMSANIIALPVEFLWLSLEYNDSIPENKFMKNKIQIEHPECLSSEDFAMEISGSSENDRVAKGYNYYIDSKRDCRYRKGDFYEYIYFDNKSTTNTFYPYLDIIHENKLVNVIPFSEKFGKYNKIADDNKERMKRVTRQTQEDFVIISLDYDILNKFDNIHIKNKKEKVIPIILKYLKNKQNVIFDKNFESVTPLKRVIKLKDDNDEIEFICKNLNREAKRSQKEFTVEIDSTYPMYFSCNNKILYNLLEMSTNFDAFERIFNKSYMFLSRIRCQWV